MTEQSNNWRLFCPENQPLSESRIFVKFVGGDPKHSYVVTVGTVETVSDYWGREILEYIQIGGQPFPAKRFNSWAPLPGFSDLTRTLTEEDHPLSNDPCFVQGLKEVQLVRPRTQPDTWGTKRLTGFHQLTGKPEGLEKAGLHPGIPVEVQPGAKWMPVSEWLGGSFGAIPISKGEHCTIGSNVRIGRGQTTWRVRDYCSATDMVVIDNGYGADHDLNKNGGTIAKRVEAKTLSIDPRY